MSYRNADKLIFILLTWPLGLWIIPQIIKLGFQLDPYALAVHEMGLILILGVLMIASFLYLFSSGNSSSPIVRTLWYGLRVGFAALLCVLLSPTPYFIFSMQAQLGVWSFILLVVVLLIVGTLVAFQRFSQA